MKSDENDGLQERNVTPDGTGSCALTEEGRLAALAAYGAPDALLGPELSSIINFATNYFKVPYARITLLYRDEQVSTGQTGPRIESTGRHASMCSHTIGSDEVLVIPDVGQDPRFGCHLQVIGSPRILFYAGAPLVSPLGGHRIGTISIHDVVPRPALDSRDAALLADLAGLVVDHFEQRRISGEHRANQTRFESMSSSNPSGVVCADIAGRITHWNKAAERMFGWRAEEVLGGPMDLIVPERLRAAHAAGLARVAASGGQNFTGRTVQLPALRRDGSEFQADLTLSCWREDGRLTFGASIQDVTDRHLAHERLRFLAHHDLLTGLVNRTRFVDLAAAAIGEGAAAITLLDLDGFKHVNDTLGHQAGDSLLREVAQRLTTALDRRGILARLGGDEFAILWPGHTNINQAKLMTGQLQDVLVQRFTIDERTFRLCASAGVAIAPAHGTEAAMLLGNADLALYQAKAGGPGSLCFFDPAMRTRYDAQRTLEADIRRAAKAGEFLLHYQPQVRLSDGELVGAEALMRWRHPERGLLHPAAFLSVLEASPLAGPVGDWTINEACRQAAIWRQSGFSLRIGINLFAEQLREGRLYETVTAALARWCLPADAIELELTETIALRHDDRYLLPLHRLRECGVGIAFDDFGTGYASLSTLKRFPLTRLKVDRSFVRDLGTDPHDAAIVQAVLAMGRGLDLCIVAEGVETEGQELFLREHGCHEGQGFRFGRAVAPQIFPSTYRRLVPTRFSLAKHGEMSVAD